MGRPDTVQTTNARGAIFVTEFSHLIEAEDDGLEQASYRQHTLEKLSIVRYYLAGFDKACRRTKRYGGWTFVDSFAGSGLV